MPVTCDTCGYQFRRRRNLRRHRCRQLIETGDEWMNEPQCSVSLPSTPPNNREPQLPSPPVAGSVLHRQTALPPSPSPVGSPLSDVDLFLGPPSPFADPEEDLTHPSPMSLCGEAYVPAGNPDTPKAWIAAATQTEPWSPTRHVRKQLFKPHLRTLKTVQPVSRPSPYEFGLQVDTRETRRHCDCASCVRHGLRLLRTDVRETIPSVPGIRFVHLPLQGTVSTAAERQQLDVILKNAPMPLTVCGCDRCGAHRDLLRAFREARRLTPPDDANTESPATL